MKNTPPENDWRVHEHQKRPVYFERFRFRGRSRLRVPLAKPITQWLVKEPRREIFARRFNRTNRPPPLLFPRFFYSDETAGNDEAEVGVKLTAIQNIFLSAHRDTRRPVRDAGKISAAPSSYFNENSAPRCVKIARFKLNATTVVRQSYRVTIFRNENSSFGKVKVPASVTTVLAVIYC